MDKAQAMAFLAPQAQSFPKAFSEPCGFRNQSKPVGLRGTKRLGVSMRKKCNSSSKVLQEQKRFLDGLEAKGIRLGLGRMEKFLASVGNPEKRFRGVHVAGSKGKGSTAAMAESILRKAGYNAGLYTSPHLVRFNERVRVNGTEISDRRLVALVSKLRREMEKSGIGLTYFEFVTALAFRHFADSGVDFAVVETGMGGRLDATNVLLPMVSVITNIEKEHALYLGNTLQKIAVEKAGIIKSGVPVVTAERKKGIIGIFKKECAKKNSALHLVKAPFKGKLALLGGFQRWNAALAVAAVVELQKQGIKVGKKAIGEGLASVNWPGRFEIMQQNPAVVLDCCHTPNSALALASAFREIFPGKKAVLVLGASSDKDIRGIIAALYPIAGFAIATGAKTRAMPAGKIKKEFEKRGIEAIGVPGVKNAVKKGIEVAGKDGIVLIAGSCFVAGEAMVLWQKRC